MTDAPPPRHHRSLRVLMRPTLQKLRRAAAVSLIGALALLPSDPLSADSATPTRGWQSPLLQDHPLVGTLWAVPTDPGQPGLLRLTEGDLLRLMLAADILLVGEKHDNPDHHLLQARILSRLIAAGRRPSVVMEHISGDQADALAAWRAAAPEDATGLAEALDWDESGWPAFSAFRPIFDRAIGAELPLIAGDLGREELRQIGRQGINSLAPERASALGLSSPLPAAAERALDHLLIDSHCGLIPPEAAPAIRGVQRGRDGALALAARQALANTDPWQRPVVVFAGSGHVRRDWAVPLVLSRTTPEATVFTLALQEVRPGQDDPIAETPGTDGVPAFDAVWFTPVITDRDYCADFR